MTKLKIVALTCGAMSAVELWTLQKLCDSGYDPLLVCAKAGTDISALKRAKRLVRDYGLVHVCSRQLGKVLVGNRERLRNQDRLSKLFDEPSLRNWFNAANLKSFDVKHLNSDDCRELLKDQQPDIIVRVSGGIVRQKTFEIARVATLNIHHGLAPQIRGVWSIPWGIVEQRPEWIGATVHRIDAGIDTGTVYRRESPQLAPGDTALTLFYRSHLLAVEGLISVLNEFANGSEPHALDYQGESVYRTAPGISAWLRYRWCRGGYRSPMLLNKAIL